MSKIAFDVDDTLGNHTEQFIAFYQRVYRKKIRFESFISYGLSNVLKVKPVEACRRLDKFYDSPEFEDISPYPGSQECIQKLSEDGEELFILTGRPKALKEKTKNWVRKYFPQIPFRNILTAVEILQGQEQLKGRICFKRSIDLIVEDSLEQALNCSTHTGVALFNRPWNESPIILPKKINPITKAITRIDTWEELYKLAKRY